MQRAITDEVHLGQTVAHGDNNGKVKSTDYLNDFKDINKKNE